MIECCLKRVSQLQYGSGFHFCQPKIRTKSIRWSKQLKDFAHKIAQLLAIKHANCNHLGIYHIITTRFAPPNKNCGLVSEKNANCCHGRKIEDCKAWRQSNKRSFCLAVKMSLEPHSFIPQVNFMIRWESICWQRRFLGLVFPFSNQWGLVIAQV